MNLCQYSQSLGVPNVGIHKHVFGFAIADLLMTMVIAFILMLFLHQYTTAISHSLLFGIILLILLAIGEYMHKIFCVQ